MWQEKSSETNCTERLSAINGTNVVLGLHELHLHFFTEYSFASHNSEALNPLDPSV